MTTSRWVLYIHRAETIHMSNEICALIVSSQHITTQERIKWEYDIYDQWLFSKVSYNMSWHRRRLEAYIHRNTLFEIDKEIRVCSLIYHWFNLPSILWNIHLILLVEKLYNWATAWVRLWSFRFQERSLNILAPPWRTEMLWSIHSFLQTQI